MIKVKKSVWGILVLVFVGISISISAVCPNEDSYCRYYPGKSWEKIKDLKAAGWLSEKLKEAHKFANTLNMAAVVVLYKGKILQQWGDVERNIPGHSIRKSFLSAMYGPAVQEGIIDPAATMKDLGIDDIEPSLTDVEKQATVQMLLEARSGVYHPAAFETKSMAAGRPKRHSHAPGTFWYYNNWDFNVLGAIYRQKTGEDIFEAFKKVIADPIGMKDFDPETDGRYVYSRSKSKYPAYPFKMSALNMARFGLLMARNGRWEDKQIIPVFWVKQSTISHSKAGSHGGYGYLWWTSINGRSHFNDISRHYGLFSARGARGHVITVIPDEHIVFVYRNDDSIKGGRTSYTNIGRLLDKVLDAKES